MSDNFDTNVAKRKPNTGRLRPSHPWDVNSHVIEEAVSASDISVSNQIASDSVIKPKEKQSPSLKKEHFLKADKITLSDKLSGVVNSDLSSSYKTDISQRHSDLSDSINIHSNFCKLDNGVSDHLCSVLSPSAQSVYLRLYRQSFGWNRNWAAESLPKLKKSCNLSLQTVRKAIKELELKGCIHKEFSDYHKATVYRVFLPSEIGISNNAPLIINSQKNTVLNKSPQHSASPNSLSSQKAIQKSDSYDSDDGEVKIFEDQSSFSGGLESVIQSVYFSGTSIYSLLESGGPLPINISKYINNKQLGDAVSTLDEFYDSIGFSIVARALYRKSLIDYFDIIKSGFSPDDIRYAVRWTFKNSRTRPESFSLIKHTMHLAMNDLINELKGISGEKDRLREKQEALIKNREVEEENVNGIISNEDIKTWFKVIEELKENINEHSYSAFIEPLTLKKVEGDRIVIKSPHDSVSWVIDHFRERIEDVYSKQLNFKVNIEIK